MAQQLLLQTLQLAANPAVILIRHAERGHIAHPSTGHNVLLTPKGESDARALGAVFSGCGPARIFHSPVPRCEQTAQALAEGARAAGADASVVAADSRLGGAYLVRPTEALELAGRLGERFVRAWFDGAIPNGLFLSRRDSAAHHARVAEEHLNRDTSGVVVLVSHDWNLLTVREEFLGIRHEDAGWPEFLDHVAFVRDGDRLKVIRGNDAGWVKV